MFILVRYFKAHEIIEIAYANCLTQNFHSNISMHHVVAYNGKFHVKLYLYATSFLCSLSLDFQIIYLQSSISFNKSYFLVLTHSFLSFPFISFKVCVRLFEVPLVLSVLVLVPLSTTLYYIFILFIVHIET